MRYHLGISLFWKGKMISKDVKFINFGLYIWIFIDYIYEFIHINITSDLEYAFDKISMGPELISMEQTKDGMHKTAIHEGGHCLIAYLLNKARVTNGCQITL